MNWDFGALMTAEGLTALLTLTVMEIVLGIDNVVFIAILVGKLPADQRGLARRIGMSLALICRLGLLFSISWVMGLTKTLFNISFLHAPITGKSLILIGGGLFLIAKASTEIYHKLEGEDHEEKPGVAGKGSMVGLIVQLILLDLVFSLDSVITAVGMAQSILIMVIAMLVAVCVMMAAAGPIGEFVLRHPSVKILALSFLNLIGVMLFAEGLGRHVEKGYIYFAMTFSLLVEVLNMRFRKKHKPVQLHDNTQILRRKPV
ncbi:MAG: TerC family protein [Planctomycetes bacterium]|nr:TerC family protein [Planctomycetota bacterium]